MKMTAILVGVLYLLSVVVPTTSVSTMTGIMTEFTLDRASAIGLSLPGTCLMSVVNSEINVS